MTASAVDDSPYASVYGANDLSDERVLLAALERQTNLPRLGRFALDVLCQADSVRAKKEQVVALLSADDLVQESGLLQQFVACVNDAEAAILRNARVIAVACEGFAGDASLDGTPDEGPWRRDGIDDDLQEQRVVSYDRVAERLGEVVNANERILLELDKLAANVVAQMADPTIERSEQMLGEMRKMREQVFEVLGYK